MYALIRTGPLHPKHAGISVVLIPMDSDGIEVRPIRRNNGDYHFNEVFFDNVRVPLDNIVGSMNDGWQINRTTMVGEHLTNFLGSQPRRPRRSPAWQDRKSTRLNSRYQCATTMPSSA